MPPVHRAAVHADGVLVEGGATLDAVGPGSVLGGRYTLGNRLDDAPDRSTWQAQDTTLDRRVRLLVVAPEHPAAEDVLDAARRAAAVDDPRLVRVLDVGHDDAGTYVVTEWLDGHDLATLVGSGPLVAEQARILVGEAALALETARRRGLHHLRLRPALVHLLEDGSVKVEGLVTEAALDQVEVTDGDEASRRDANGLVALAYAGLTGLWPHDGDPDLARAPRLQGSPAPPSQLVPGVPADLDALCAQVLAGQGGPATPGDLARQIAPWGNARRTPRAEGAFPHALPPVRLAPGTPGSPDTPLRRGDDRGGEPTGGRTGPTAPVTAPIPASAAQTVATTAPTPAAAATTAPTPTVLPTTAPTPTTAAPTPGPEPEPARGKRGKRAKREKSGRTADQPSASSAVTAAAATAAPATAAPAAATAAAAPPEAPTRRPEPVQAPRPERPVAANARRADTEPVPAPTAGASLLDVAQGGRLRSGDSAPLARPPRRQARAAIAVVVGFLIVIALLAWKGLSGLGIDPFAGSRSANPSASATSAPSGSATSGATSGLRIASASAFDPDGDGSEHDDAAGRAVDRDPSTSWTSDQYRSARFGGLKPGVGLRIRLDGSQEVHQVQVSVGGSGSTVQLRQLQGNNVSSTVLARQAGASGTVTLRPSSPVRTDELVIWFTRAASAGGGYRVEVAEVSVS